MTRRNEMEAVFEALLFVSPEPLPRQRLLALFPDGEEQSAAALDTVIERYRMSEEAAERGRGVQIDEAAGGYRLVTRPDLHAYLRRFFEISGRSRLSMAALETLAIIAYRQPITGPEIQELRGKSSSGVLRTLLERRLIRIAGRKPVVGKPFLYGTTREFMVHFGLGTLKDLPPLEELEDGLLSDSEAAELTGEGGDREEQIELEIARSEARDTAAETASDDDRDPEDSSSRSAPSVNSSSESNHG